MAGSILFKMNQVSLIYKEKDQELILSAPTNQWSLSEWINNFLRDDGLYYGDTEYDDTYLPEHEPMPGGDADGMYEGDIDDGILESLIIIVLAAALVFLIYYRQQRQLAGHGRNNNQQAAGAQQGNQQAPQGNQQVPQGQQEDRGLFPQPGDPEFGQWVAGGVGH
jgi:SEL1 protein